jgi:beta-mannosidase
MSIEDFVYWAGLVQGVGLREYIDNFHRRMFDTSSAIFWMYNDTWPAVRSWTIVDYYLNRTPAFCAVKRAMAPVNVVVARENDDIAIFGINETRESISRELRYGVFNLAGGYPIDKKQSVELKPNASTRLASFPASQWTNQEASAAFAMLSSNGKVIARNRMFIPLFKELKWSSANVRVKLHGGNAIFESDAFAWGVCLDLNGETSLPDNFFDVYPGVPQVIPWKESHAPKILRLGNLTQ